MKYIKKIFAILSICGLLFPQLARASEHLPPVNAPDDPPLSSLSQSDDGGKNVSVGGIISSTSFNLMGQLSQDLENSQSDTIYLEAEVESTTIPFDFVPNHVSQPYLYTGTNIMGSIKLVGFAEGSYHWQVRVRNSQGKTSNWVAFGENLDLPNLSASDFVLNLPPAAPSNPKSKAQSENSVLLNWVNALDSDLKGTNVWRRNTNTNIETLVAFVDKATKSFIDTGLEEGTVYSYRLKSVDSVDNVSQFSDVTTAVTDIVIDEQETGGRIIQTGDWDDAGINDSVLIAETNEDATLSYFPNIPVSTDYEIYVSWIVSPDDAPSRESQAKDASYSVIVNNLESKFIVDQTRLADQLSTPIGIDVPSGYYKLGTFSLPAGTQSVVKLISSTTGYVVADKSRFVYLRPLPPTNLTATDIEKDNGNNIRLTWLASPSGNIVNYNVYRSTSSSSYDFSKPLATVTDIAYTDYSTTADVNYYYVVRASDRSQESINSNETSVVAKDNLAPSVPTIKLLEVGDGFVILNWEKVVDASAYVVRYRLASSTGDFSTMLIQGPDTTSSKITGLLNGTDYEFGVAAQDSSGNRSSFAFALAAPKAAVIAPVIPVVETAAVVPTAPKRAVVKAAVAEEPQETPAPAPAIDEKQEAKIKAEQAQRERRQRAGVTVAILVIAVAAGIAGYYGYDWWLKQSQNPPRGRSKNGRW